VPAGSSSSATHGKRGLAPVRRRPGPHLQAAAQGVPDVRPSAVGDARRARRAQAPPHVRPSRARLAGGGTRALASGPSGSQSMRGVRRGAGRRDGPLQALQAYQSCACAGAVRVRLPRCRRGRQRLRFEFGCEARRCRSRLVDSRPGWLARLAPAVHALLRPDRAVIAARGRFAGNFLTGGTAL
jgi:hypothetical protein